MSWIKIIEKEEATGALHDLYEHVESTRGKMSNILRVHSLHPKAMQAHLDLYLSIMFSRSKLRRADRELLAVVVSATNGCDYCIQHHAEALRFYWKDEAKVQQVIDDYRAADLPEKTRALLDYAVKLTRAPSSAEEADVQRLRNRGFSDEDILSINLITSYFNFANRIAEGLGVDFSPEEVEGYRY